MATNILIGIGGTGAKVVEATMHCLAAGLGPDDVQIVFVDQDKSNGNVARAIQTAEAIRKARRHWSSQAGAHRIGSSNLLRTDLPIEPDLWVPYQREQTDLVHALEILEADRPGLDLLFDKSEQDLKLDIGFQAKAHVGSAAIASAIHVSGGVFWDYIREQIGNAAAGPPVNIVLAGSVFGGSGAAGFPTIARLLRRAVAGGRVRIGGMLMLPYFKFSDPSLDTAAKFKELVPQTRGALRYYSSLVEREERVFDQLYLVGWDRYFDLGRGYSEPGGGKQKNPALLPELLAALGACRFLADPREDDAGRTELFVSTRTSEASFGWQDLPGTEGGGGSPFVALGRQIRFALAWKHWHPLLSKSEPAWRAKFARYGWYRRYGLAALDRENTPVADALGAMSSLVDLQLKWAASIQAYWSRQEGINAADPQKPNNGFGLWHLLDPDLLTISFQNPTEPVTIAESIDEQTFGRLFSRAIPGRTEADRLPGAEFMLQKLHSSRPVEDSRGLGGIVRALHELSSVRPGVGGGA